MTIYLGRQLPAASSDLPGQFSEQLHPAPIRSCCGWGLPSRPVTWPLVRSCRTVSSLPGSNKSSPGGLFSVALSLGSPPLDVIQHPALCSSDFPQMPPFGLAPAAIISARISNTYYPAAPLIRQPAQSSKNITKCPRKAPGFSPGEESGLPPLGGHGFLVIGPLVIAPSQALRLKSKPVGNASRQAPGFAAGSMTISLAAYPSLPQPDGQPSHCG